MDNGASSYRRFLNGDDGGVVEIIKEYRDGLIFYLTGIVGDICTAEDLAEETFVKLVTKKPRFREDSAFKTWLYAIGRNLAMDHIRRIARKPEIPLEDFQGLCIPDEDVMHSSIKKEQADSVRRALWQLKPEQRQVLLLIYFEGFSNREAGKIMKKTTHSIETLVYRARLSLKALLDEEGFIYEEL